MKWAVPIGGRGNIRSTNQEGEDILGAPIRRERTYGEHQSEPSGHQDESSKNKESFLP